MLNKIKVYITISDYSLYINNLEYNVKNFKNEN